MAVAHHSHARSPVTQQDESSLLMSMDLVEQDTHSITHAWNIVYNYVKVSSLTHHVLQPSLTFPVSPLNLRLVSNSPPHTSKHLSQILCSRKHVYVNALQRRSLYNRTRLCMLSDLDYVIHCSLYRAALLRHIWTLSGT